MCNAGSEQERDHPNSQPPVAYNENKKSFFDLKLSHFIEIFLTFILIGVGVFQVCIYIRQSGIMQTQADIAKVANNINISVQRASVNAGQLKMEKYVVQNDAERKRAFWRFSPIFTNDGSTSTKNLFIYTVGQVSAVPTKSGDGSIIFKPEATTRSATLIFSIPIFSQKPPAVFFPPDPQDGFDKGKIGIYIGPHGSVNLSSVSIPEDDLINDIKSGYGLHVFGETKYKDTLRDQVEHITKFCYSVSGDFSIGGEFSPVQNFCPHWNCADEECESDKDRNTKDVAKVILDRASEEATEAIQNAQSMCVSPRADCTPQPSKK